MGTHRKVGEKKEQRNKKQNNQKTKNKMADLSPNI